MSLRPSVQKFFKGARVVRSGGTTCTRHKCPSTTKEARERGVFQEQESNGTAVTATAAAIALDPLAYTRSPTLQRRRRVAV